LEQFREWQQSRHKSKSWDWEGMTNKMWFERNEDKDAIWKKWKQRCDLNELKNQKE
jgi:hypothetical protein